MNTSFSTRSPDDLELGGTMNTSFSTRSLDDLNRATAGEALHGLLHLWWGPALHNSLYKL
jgi:hypothetical protein